MSTPEAVDAARIALLLNELRLPAIKTVWAQFAEQADKELGPPLPTSWSTRSPSAADAASSAISLKPAYRPEKPCTPSTSRLCR